MFTIIEFLLWLIVSLLSITFLALDVAGILKTSTWFTNKLPSAILILLSTFALYTVIQHKKRKDKLDKMEQNLTKKTEEIIKSTAGLELKKLSTAEELFSYLAKRVKKATKSVDDLTWGNYPNMAANQATIKNFRKYLTNIQEACSEKEDIRYREVITFPNIERIKRAEKLIEKDLPGYHLRYYDLPHEQVPPLLQYVLIDNKELILHTHRAGSLPIEQETYLAIKNPEMIEFFQDYYEAIWNNAEVLKDAERTNEKILNKIRNDMTND